MRTTVSRWSFLFSLGSAGLATTLAARAADTSGAGKAATNTTEPLNVKVCNPLRRTPLSFIIDDSCPVTNKAYCWIQQMHEWRLRHRSDSIPSGWEVHYDKLDQMPNTIPATFAAKWGEWCGEQGIRGKFSLVPFPAGMGRIDQDFPGFPERDGRLAAGGQRNHLAQLRSHARDADAHARGRFEDLEIDRRMGARCLGESAGGPVDRVYRLRDATAEKRGHSEIGHYWMAQQFSEVAVQGQRVRVRTQFPTPNFTLALGVAAQRVQVKGIDLKRVQALRDFRSSTFWIEGQQTFAAFDLGVGETVLSVTA
jgi:hypothetical protein